MLAEKIRTETGLIVLPLRLTGLFYDHGPAGDRLTLALRCLMRGGALAQEDGAAKAAFFPTAPMPEPMSPADNHLVGQALQHAGGLPALEIAPLPVSSRLLRRFGAGDAGPTGEWSLHVVSAIPDSAGHVAVMPDDKGEVRILPGAAVEPGETPWAAATRVATAVLGRAIAITGLPAIYIDDTAPQMTLLFLHETQTAGTAGNVVWLDPTDQTSTMRSLDREQALTALQPAPATTFQMKGQV